MDGYQSQYYAHIALIIVFSLYYGVGMLCYYLKRKKPSIKARKARLVLMSAIGLFV